MQRISDPSRIPHGGSFHVTHPISGQQFASPNMQAVFFAFRKHAKENNYPILEPVAIESLMCEQHPDWCSERASASNQQLAQAVSKSSALNQSEISALLPDLTDPTLIGNRIARLTSALGIPTCGGCSSRQVWLNRAHEWLRNNV